MKIQTQLDDLIGVLKYCQHDQEKIEKCFEKTLRSLSTHALKKYRKQYKEDFDQYLLANLKVNQGHLLIDGAVMNRSVLYIYMTRELHDRGIYIKL